MGKRKGGVKTVLEKDYSFLKMISKSLEPSKKKSRNTTEGRRVIEMEETAIIRNETMGILNFLKSRDMFGEILGNKTKKLACICLLFKLCEASRLQMKCS